MHVQKSQLPSSFVPSLSLNVGHYGMTYILENGGHGYFPGTMLTEQLDNGSLVVIEDAPIIQQPVYLAYCKDNKSSYLKDLLLGFHQLNLGI